MSLTLDLTPPVEKRLAERAARAGKTVEALVADFIERSLGPEKTFDEILAPFRQSVAESGMTDEELDEFFQEIRQEVWDERHGARK